jgi:hypothetical protein
MSHRDELLEWMTRSALVLGIHHHLILPIDTVAVRPATRRRSGGTSSSLIRTGMRWAKRTQLKVGAASVVFDLTRDEIWFLKALRAALKIPNTSQQSPTSQPLRGRSIASTTFKSTFNCEIKQRFGFVEIVAAKPVIEPR